MNFENKRPEPDEYRYYIRVEQLNGNMGWTSPVWVQAKYRLQPIPLLHIEVSQV